MSSEEPPTKRRIRKALKNLGVGEEEENKAMDEGLVEDPSVQVWLQMGVRYKMRRDPRNPGEALFDKNHPRPRRKRR
jgi:hypothetical protein